MIIFWCRFINSGIKTDYSKSSETGKFLCVKIFKKYNPEVFAIKFPHIYILKDSDKNHNAHGRVEITRFQQLYKPRDRYHIRRSKGKSVCDENRQSGNKWLFLSGLKSLESH